MAIGISHSLLKGFGVRAGLEAIIIVGEDSKPFSLIRQFYQARDGLEKPGSWKQIAMELEEVFQTRQASPHSRLSDGQTLIHVCYNSLYQLHR